MEPDYFPTLRELHYIRKYKVGDDSILQLIFHKRYGHLNGCPKCYRSGQAYKLTNRKAWSWSCGHQTFPLVGTIFEKSVTPLNKWMEAIYLVYKTDGKIPALELNRQLFPLYRFKSNPTAWRMKHVICDYLGIQKSYTYQYSTKVNGRYSQTSYRLAHGMTPLAEYPNPRRK